MQNIHRWVAEEQLEPRLSIGFRVDRDTHWSIPIWNSPQIFGEPVMRLLEQVEEWCLRE
ncbi:MAG: hypothetical protein FWE27_01315 [Defluviitaleaceae bacterium]|nr:hypothetical protein [Defluviitaleaceae bacterium]